MARSHTSIQGGILDGIEAGELDEPFDLEKPATARLKAEPSEPESSSENLEECITAVPERRVATLLPPAVSPPASLSASNSPLSTVAPAVAPATSLRPGTPRETYYLRLQLRKDCLADLWVRDLTPHNVLAWSDGMSSWVPLLAVPELREAISTAKSRQVMGLSSAPPPPPVARSQAPARPSQPPPLPVSIPRPARVPEFHASAPTPVQPQPGAAKAEVADLSDDAVTADGPTEQVQAIAVAETLAPPAITIAPKSGVAIMSPFGHVRHAALVNWERALWLAAGVSVASAASLVFGGRSAPTATETAAALQAAPVSQGPTRVGVAVPQATPAPPSDTPRVEDLPLVGKHGRLILSSTASTLRDGKPQGASSLGRKSAEQSQAKAAAESSGFDPGQARRVLASAASRARNCSDGPASGAVQVLFAPSGMVQNATLLHVQGEGVRTACVLRAFQEARVSQFSGAPIAVRKSFSF